jgi:hypothetical protein
MITRRRVTPIPITPAIIRMVHCIAEQDGMPKGLKITNHTGQVLYDSTWIAGVDYDEDEFEDEDYHPSSDEDEDSDDSDDDDDDEDMYDEMDPDAIAALNDPTTLQDDEDSEDSDEEEQPQVKEPDEEEESEEESEEEQDPNPTTAEEQTIPENAQMTRSGRISKPRQVLNLYQSHLQAETHQEVPYSLETAHVIAITMCHLSTKIENLNNQQAFQFIQTYSLKSGLKKFGERAETAATIDSTYKGKNKVLYVKMLKAIYGM